MSIILFIVILFVLVIVHEFGHFIVAKAFGIRVDEFGFGFPPKAVTLFRKGGTDYTLNWIPFGGFVRIYGENPLDVLDKNDNQYSRSFVSKAKYKQALVLLAGVIFNFVFAWILMTATLMIGINSSHNDPLLSKYITTEKFTITDISKKSAAELAGLKTGDELVAVSSQKNILNFADKAKQDVSVLRNFVQSNSTQKITFDVKRNNVAQKIVVIPQKTAEGNYAIGVGVDLVGKAQIKSLPKALVTGFVRTTQIGGQIIVAFKNIIIGGLTGKTETLSQVTGPVGIVSVVGDAWSMGIAYVLFFTSVISVNLAIINLVPFPALDGGRLLFLLIESITGKKIRPKIFNLLNTVGFFILIGLMLFVTFKDVMNLVK